MTTCAQEVCYPQQNNWLKHMTDNQNQMCYSQESNTGCLILTLLVLVYHLDYGPPQCIHLEIDHSKPLAKLHTQGQLHLMTSLEELLQKSEVARGITYS